MFGAFTFTSLILFEESIRFQLIGQIGRELSMGFANVFSQFLTFTNIIIFLGSLVLSSAVVHDSMEQRRRDIGIMKSVGCLARTVYGYFILEIFFIVGLGTVLGVLSGIAANHITFTLSNFGFQYFSTQINFLNIVFITVIFFISCTLIGVRSIRKTVLMNSATAISSLREEDVSYSESFLSQINFGLSLKIVFRNILRRRWEALRTIISLTFIIMFVTTLTVGGAIANFTTQHYVSRAIGSNVLLIGHPDIIQKYTISLTMTDNILEEEFDLFNPKYAITDNFIERLSTLEGVLKLDRRLLAETVIREVPGVIIDPDEPDIYTTIGDHRQANAFVVGIYPQEIVNNWVLLGDSLDEESRSTVMIGDALASNTFTRALDQKIIIFNKQLEIKGIVLDPLNKGYVTYTYLDELQSLIGTSTINFIFIQIEEKKLNEAILSVQDILKDTVFKVEELNPILYERLSFLNNNWSLVQLAPFLAFIAAIVAIFNYMTLSTLHQKRTIGIMRSVGAKNNFILKILYLQGTIIIILSSIFGIGLGLIMNFVLLIPSPYIPSSSLLQILFCIVIAIALLSIAGIFPAKRIIRFPITEIISNP